MWASDRNDSEDLGDWIVQQEWSNGKIMTFGASADGIASLQTIKSKPKWLQGQYIAWMTSQIYQILLPYGTYKQKTAEDWLLDLTLSGDSNAIYDNIDIVHENEAHTDYWLGVEVSDNEFSYINFPNAIWGGWYDLFLLGTLQAFDGYNLKSDLSVRYTSKIIIDPCGHCLEAQNYFLSHSILGRTALVLAQMFEVYGIRPVKRSSVKNVTFYVMSSNDSAGLQAGGYWTSLSSFPKVKYTDYYLLSDQILSTKPMYDNIDENNQQLSSSSSSSSSYLYNPLNPVPTIGGNNLPDSIGGSIPCGPLDHSSIDNRDDILKFQSDIISEGDEIVITGTMTATLYVSSTAIDTDFMIKISDVYPSGEVRIIQDNAIRMRWRENGLEPTYMLNNTIYKVELNLWNTSYVFAEGHAIRITITSSNYPRFSINNNNGILLSDTKNYPGPIIKATNTLYHSLRYQSKITLPIILNKRIQLPEVRVIYEVQSMYPFLTDERLEKYSMMIGARKK